MFKKTKLARIKHRKRKSRLKRKRREQMTARVKK